VRPGRVDDRPARSASAHGAQLRDHDEDFSYPLTTPAFEVPFEAGDPSLVRGRGGTSVEYAPFPRARSSSRPIILSTIRLISRRGDVCENTATEAGSPRGPARFHVVDASNGRGRRNNNGSRYFVTH